MEQDNSISLRFGLKENRNADLEVIASAALRWVEAMQTCARTIDPGATIKIELVNVDNNSLQLNTVFEWIEKQLTRIDEGSSQYPRLRKLALALAIFVVVQGGPTYEYYFGEETEVSLSKEDRARIDSLLRLFEENSGISTPKLQFFRELERDPSITRVELIEDRGSPPLVSVPSSEFAARSGLFAVLEDEQEKTTTQIIDVILVSPVLISEPRSWKFQQQGLNEFGAVMRDQSFLLALEHSHIQERLRTGIPMTIRLETRERLENGVWKLRRGGRSVMQVISPKIDHGVH